MRHVVRLREKKYDNSSDSCSYQSQFPRCKVHILRFSGMFQMFVDALGSTRMGSRETSVLLMSGFCILTIDLRVCEKRKNADMGRLGAKGCFLARRLGIAHPV